MLLPQEGAGRAQRIEPRPAAAPLLNCPGPGQTDFGRFFESKQRREVFCAARLFTTCGGSHVSRAT